MELEERGAVYSSMMDPVIWMRARENRPKPKPSTEPETPAEKEPVIIGNYFDNGKLKPGNTMIPNHLGNILPGGVVFLRSCSNAGETDEGQNMANYMLGIVPYDVTVIASKSDYSFDQISFPSYVPLRAVIKTPENTFIKTRIKPTAIDIGISRAINLIYAPVFGMSDGIVALGDMLKQ
jgi:hypothetical protein